MQGTIDRLAYEYLAVCVPIVVLGAPFGSLIGSHFHRQLLAGLVYLLDTVALVSAFVIVKLTTWLIVACVLIIVIGFSFFGILAYAGQKLMARVVEDEIRQENLRNTAQPADIVISNTDTKTQQSAVNEGKIAGNTGVSNDAFDEGGPVHTTGL